MIALTEAREWRDAFRDRGWHELSDKSVGKKALATLGLYPPPDPTSEDLWLFGVGVNTAYGRTGRPKAGHVHGIDANKKWVVGFMAATRSELVMVRANYLMVLSPLRGRVAEPVHVNIPYSDVSDSLWSGDRKVVVHLTSNRDISIELAGSGAGIRETLQAFLRRIASL